MNLCVFMLVCLLIFGLGYMATKLLSAKAFPIRQVQVDGYFRYVNQNSLKAKISPYIKGNFFTIDIKKIHTAIKTIRERLSVPSDAGRKSGRSLS